MHAEDADPHVRGVDVSVGEPLSDRATAVPGLVRMGLPVHVGAGEEPPQLGKVLGVGLTAFGGAVILPYVTVFPGVGGQLVVLMFTVVVLGGLGSIAGAVVGGLTVGVIQALSSLFFPIQLQNLVLFIVFILVLAVRPQGLIGASR